RKPPDLPEAAQATPERSTTVTRTSRRARKYVTDAPMTPAPQTRTCATRRPRRRRVSVRDNRALGRQLVAVGWRRDLERVHDPGQEREVVRGGRQLDHPLGIVPLRERVENTLIDTVRAHQLPCEDHDFPLLGGKLGRIAFRPDEVDD